MGVSDRSQPSSSVISQDPAVDTPLLVYIVSRIDPPRYTQVMIGLWSNRELLGYFKREKPFVLSDTTQ